MVNKTKTKKRKITQKDIDSVFPTGEERAGNGKKIPTPKMKKFAKKYAETQNGVKSALESYETDDPKVASQIAMDNLAKPIVRREILEIMMRSGIEIDDVVEIHKRNMNQDKHLPTSQKAVDSFYSLLGLSHQDKPTNDVKIAFIINK